MPGRLYAATGGRLFAALYDRVLAATEDAGLRARRHELLADARGRTLEIGAGTGLNLSHYPQAVTELVVAEPGEHMARRLRARLAEEGRAAQVVEAGAEALPFPDDSFDTVVMTLVLCTIPDPGAALREVARVLRPDGRLLFLEHVRSREERAARWQDRADRVWPWLADGCHPNRDTLATLEASPLVVERVEHGRLPKAAPPVRPMITGTARPA